MVHSFFILYSLGSRTSAPPWSATLGSLRPTGTPSACAQNSRVRDNFLLLLLDSLTRAFLSSAISWTSSFFLVVSIVLRQHLAMCVFPKPLTVVPLPGRFCCRCEQGDLCPLLHARGRRRELPAHAAVAR